MKHILFFSRHSGGKLGVPHGDIERHGDQFKDCVLLGTGKRANRDGEWGMKRFRILEARPNFQASKCAINQWRLYFAPFNSVKEQLQPSTNYKGSFYLAVFPCKVSVHLKFWINLILLSFVVPSKGKINPIAWTIVFLKKKKTRSSLLVSCKLKIHC